MKPLRAATYASAPLLSTTLVFTTMLASTVLLSACSEGDLPPPIATAGTATAEAGTGGMPGSGGTSAQGGGGGAAGSGGAGGGTFTPDPSMVRYPFTASLETFRVNFCSPEATCGAVPMPVEPSPVGADAGADAGSSIGVIQSSPFFELAHDPDVGDPVAGSGLLTVQFTGATQLVNFAINFAEAQDLSRKRITARVRQESGPATTVKMYIKTGMTYIYADSGALPLMPGSWLEVDYPSTTRTGFSNAGFDPAQVLELGLEIGSASATAGAAVVHIDTFSY